jgi:hypothetical protein
MINKAGSERIPARFMNLMILANRIGLKNHQECFRFWESEDADTRYTFRNLGALRS